MRIVLNIFFGLLVFPLLAQSPQQLVDRYLQAIGGRENLDAIKTIRADIVMEANGMAMQGSLAIAYPDKQFVEMNMRGEKIITVLNGKSGWIVNPLTGSSSPIPMSGEQIRSSRGNLTMDHLKDPNTYTLEDLGEKKVKGRNYRVLKVNFKQDALPQQLRYFNTETGLVDFIGSKLPAGGDILIEYSGYREAAGVKFPTVIMSYTGNDLEIPSTKMTLRNLEVNKGVDDTMFEKPGK